MSLALAPCTFLSHSGAFVTGKSYQKQSPEKSCRHSKARHLRDLSAFVLFTLNVKDGALAGILESSHCCIETLRSMVQFAALSLL